MLSIEPICWCRSAWKLAQKLNVEAPIIEGIYKVVHEGGDPVQIVSDVMSRELRSEVDPQVMAAARL